MRVLAKATGTKPVFILPGGKEKLIRRRGIISILEEKKVLRKAASQSAQVLVVELMSFSPESLYAESRRMFRPHVTVITNVRMDHITQAGRSKDEIAENMARSFNDLSTVFIPEEESRPVFQDWAFKRKSRLIRVGKLDSPDEKSFIKKIPKSEFLANIRLVVEVCDFLDIKRETSYTGIIKALPDIGSLKLWKAEFTLPKRSWDLISAFSANDPESTRLVIDKIVQSKNIRNKKWIGLFNIRKDRGDRTHQWMSAFTGNLFPEFQKIIFLGEQSDLLKSKLGKKIKTPEFGAFRSSNPKKIMSYILNKEKKNCVLVGLGNIKGIGMDLLDHWDTIGMRHDL